MIRGTTPTHVFSDTYYNKALIIAAGNDMAICGNSITNHGSCIQIGDGYDTYDLTITNNVGKTIGNELKAIDLTNTSTTCIITGNRLLGTVNNDGTNNLVENNLITS